MPIAPILLPEDAFVRAAMTVRGKYSFAVDGGAVSSINVTTGLPIPSGSVILGGYMDVGTAIVGAGATAALQVEGAGDLIAAAAVSGAPWSTTGRKSLIPVFTGATTVKTTADRNIVLVITAAVLTVGIFDVVLIIVPPLA